MFKSKWGQWTDISTGSSGCFKYILQARRHKNGKVQMRTECKEAHNSAVQPTIDQLKEVTFKPKTT